VGIFFIEASGFPKGLAALDINSENIGKSKMLDPRKLTQKQADSILSAFNPLLSRKILSTDEEYQQDDRLAFERVVAEAFRYTPLFERIKDCLLDMQRVRLSVKRNR
jgi:hypothetical protein